SSRHLRVLNASPATDTYTLSLHDALPISDVNQFMRQVRELYDESVSIGRLNMLYRENSSRLEKIFAQINREERPSGKEQTPQAPDRKSTRLNSSHVSISYAVVCLKKKKRV